MDFETLANQESINNVIKALAPRHVEAVQVKSRAEAMEKIKAWIPKGSSVMNGASVTLEQIGYVDYLKSDDHGWKNLKADIVAEKDPEKQTQLRKHALVSDFYLGSVHAVAETGEYVVGSNTGSQLPHVVYSSPNLILVVSTKKIVPTLPDALRRLEEHVVPLEDLHMKQLYGPQSGTTLSKELIVRNESSFSKRKIRMLLIEENLGF